MEHFISIIYNESVDEQGLAECLASTNTVLNENEIEFYTGKLGNVKTIRMPLPEAIDNVEQTAEVLAMRLFEFGLKKFEIELTEATLRRGSRGPEVQALQQQLGITADGIYGPNTEAAVRAFQQRAGIQVDGIAGGQTQSALAAGGSPRNAGAPRASTAPFTADGGSTTQAPPQPQSAAPQTSPRPQARPEQPAAPAAGLDDTAARADIAQQRADQQAAAQRRADQQAAPTGRGDGSAEVARRRDDREADQLAQDTLAALDAIPAPQGELGATDQAQIGTPSSRLDRKGETPSGPVGQAMDQRGAAAAGTPSSRLDRAGETPSTGRSTSPVQPIGRMSSSRPNDPETGAVVRPGDETNALDAIAQDRETGALPQPPAQDTATPTRSGPTTRGGRRGPRPDPNANAPQPQAQITAPTMAANDTGSDAAPSVSTTTDPEVSREIPQAPAFGGGERDVNVDTNAPSQAAPSVDPQVAQGVAGTFYQAMKGGTGIGTNERQIQRQLAGLQNADTFRAAAEAYQQENGSDLFADFYDEMNDKDFNRFVAPELRRLGIEIPPRSQYESAGARPKGAFMFRERNEWIAKYGATHNIDGTRKRQNISEGLESLEETFDDDDEFFETYGIMWYNEDEALDEAEYQGRTVKLGKPMAGDVKKFKVYVRNDKGNVVKVNFGQKGARIKKDNAKRRRSFRARHNCKNPGPRWKARYWSCKKW